MIKRYASHYLCLPTKEIYRQYIVEVEDGVVKSYYPLEGEIHSVNWLGGIIVLSFRKDLRIEKEMSFKDFLFSLNSEHVRLPLYAYYLDGVDLQKLTLSSNARLRRLD